MILISHRGNLVGPNPKIENTPEYIKKAISLGYDVEIDVWIIKNKIYLGHDDPQYFINKTWLDFYKKFLWLHCKNIEAINYFSNNKKSFNYFWHEKDTITLTSKKYIWAYPGKQPIKNSIAVSPELYNDNLTHCLGICSDYIQKYKMN
jgi:hypothetical protein